MRTVTNILAGEKHTYTGTLGTNYVEVFAGEPYTADGPADALDICNQSGTERIYVAWVKKGAAAPTTKVNRVILPYGSLGLPIDYRFFDVYVKASASLTYTASLVMLQ